MPSTAWNEWKQLKAEALRRQQDSSHTQLNQLGGSGPTSAPGTPDSYGDLKVANHSLTAIGTAAFDLYNHLWDKARIAVPSSDSAAADLSKQGFALGAGLRHVSDRWEEQLTSLMDACAHISNHMRVTKKLHDGDEGYIQRQMSSIDALDAGFDEQVGEPNKKSGV